MKEKTEGDTMSETKRTVALIYGGRGHEAAVSVSGAEYAWSLLYDRYDILPVYIAKDGRWLTAAKSANTPYPCRDFSKIHREILQNEVPIFPYLDAKGSAMMLDGVPIKIDAAIPLLHGDFGEDGTVQGALTNARIKYVGCDVYTGSLCMDKLNTKLIAASYGANIANFVKRIAYSKEEIPELIKEAEAELEYPMFVKPNRLGSSVGASLATSEEELSAALHRAVSTGGGALVEEAVDILREAECADYKTARLEIISDVGGRAVDGGFYDYDRKYSGSTGANVYGVLQIDGDIRHKIREQTRKLARALRIRHLSRFDYFITRDNRIIFNEINTFPGFTSGSLWPKLIENTGLCAGDALSGLIEDALAE